MLSIGEFSEMCHLSPQTLRFYHSEGLLVPAEVDERTGYRSYAFAQVETAVLVTVLRGTGMSVASVRAALHDPDTLPAVLAEHTDAVVRRRRVEDEAISDARGFVEAWPQVRDHHQPAVTVLSTPLCGVPAEERAAARGDDWAWVDAATATTVDALTEVARSQGAAVAGRPWRTWAIETPEQKRAGLTAEGPQWLVKVPVATDGAALGDLPEGVDVQELTARDELSLFLPGRSSMAKYGTALSRLVTHPLERAFVDLSAVRHVVHDDGIETTAGIVALDGESESHTPCR